MIWLLHAALAAAPAPKSDGTPVLVSTLQPRNDESKGLASLVEGFLAQELAKNPALRVVRVDDTPDFEDYAARTYMEGCPVGDGVGCTQVVAERGGARFAVTGMVQSLVSGTRVTIDILDVDASRVVLSFTSELDSGNDEAFAEGVAKVLVAAIGGDLGEKDIREKDAPEDDAATDAEIARQLDELAKETGGATAIVHRESREIAPPKYTVEDLAKHMASDTTTPWERVGMTPNEYMRYKNSGKSLRDWRTLAIGRKGALIARPWLGFGRGPFGGEYYGRYAVDLVGTEQTVVDSLSAQAVQTVAAGGGGLQVAYGLTPAVEVGVVGGVYGGSYTISMDQEQVGTPTGDVEPETRQTSSIVFGPRVILSPLPTLMVRPVAGVGVMLAHGGAIGSYYQVDDALVAWPAPWLVSVEAMGGGEARIAKNVDLFVHVPFEILVSGETLQTDRHGTTDALAEYTPVSAETLGVGVQAGVQLRFGGAKPQASTRFDDVGEPEDDE